MSSRQRDIGCTTGGGGGGVADGARQGARVRKQGGQVAVRARRHRGAGAALLVGGGSALSFSVDDFGTCGRCSVDVASARAPASSASGSVRPGPSRWRPQSHWLRPST